MSALDLGIGSTATFIHLIPEIFLGLLGFAILWTGVRNIGEKVISWTTFAGLGIAALLVFLLDPSSGSAYSGVMVFNNFGKYFAIIMLISSMFICYPFSTKNYQKSEIFYSTLLFLNVGMVVAAFSYNLIALFIAFESVSIGTYVLSSFGKTRRNLEASIKYFFTGTIATAFILFGASFYYMGTGTFSISSSALSHVTGSPEITLALAFLIIGFGFKLALFPFHQWALDTYDGTENSVSAFLAAGSKILAFMVILKVFLSGFSFDHTAVFYLFVILSIITMTYGNISALSQSNLKRILSYSSIAQAGYLVLVLAVVAGSGSPTSTVSEFAIAAGMFYSLVYIFMKGGAFITMNAVPKDNVELEDVSGLGKRSPATAVSLSVIMLALAGIPLTGGFLAKYYLFLALIEGSLWWLAVIAILNSAISVFYYFRVITYMFARDPAEGETAVPYSAKAPVVAAAVITVALFFIGIIASFMPTLISAAGGIFG